MWRALVILPILFISVNKSLASPEKACSDAEANCLLLLAKDRHHYRWLTLYAIPEKETTIWLKLLSVHINSLSSEANLEHPVLVNPTLLRIDCRNYGKQFSSVYERLGEVDPHFHLIANVPVPDGPKRKNTLPVPRGKVRRQRTKVLIPELAKLASYTKSSVPLIRADWFFGQTAIQEARVAGYYDFHNLKKRDDFFKLVGFNLKEAQRVKREVAAIVLKSGIAKQNRVVDRFGAIDGPLWRTRDAFDTSTGKKNALRFLDNDYEHDAEEHIGFLPNRLMAFYLSDKNGVQQNRAPDKVGPDSTSTSHDTAIHSYLSCMRCHSEGIRPISDYGRRLYSPPLSLQDKDYDRFLRLKQLYLGELKRLENRDRITYQETIQDFVGLKTIDLSKAYIASWKFAVDDDVTLTQAALEIGMPEAKFKNALWAYFKISNSIDPVLAGYLRTPPESLPREYFDEVFSLAKLLSEGKAPL